jgi:N-methylhydantoinase A
MVTAPVTRVYQRPVMRALTPETESELQDLLRRAAGELELAGRRELESDGYEGERAGVEASLDMRYVGQSYEISVPLLQTGPHPDPLPEGEGEEKALSLWERVG